MVRVDPHAGTLPTRPMVSLEIGECGADVVKSVTAAVLSEDVRHLFPVEGSSRLTQDAFHSVRPAEVTPALGLLEGSNLQAWRLIATKASKHQFEAVALGLDLVDFLLGGAQVGLRASHGSLGVPKELLDDANFVHADILLDCRTVCG